jgi:hypothetical protein
VYRFGVACWWRRAFHPPCGRLSGEPTVSPFEHLMSYGRSRTPPASGLPTVNAAGYEIDQVDYVVVQPRGTQDGAGVVNRRQWVRLAATVQPGQKRATRDRTDAPAHRPQRTAAHGQRDLTPRPDNKAAEPTSAHDAVSRDRAGP